MVTPPVLLAHPMHVGEAASALSLLRALASLAKPRLAAFSVLTTLVAYFTAHSGATVSDTIVLLVGTALAAAGALSLNQWRERDTDFLMSRTRHRPLPAGEISPRVALAWSVAHSIAGIVWLWSGVNFLAALFAAATILVYGAIYTPLKRRSRWATEVGAVSGALPALIGNAAAGNVWSAPGVVLTVVLLFWQMPHFFAIGWRCRADYRAARFPLLPAIDSSGARTGAWSFGYAALLLAASLAPWALGWLGAIYGVCATMAGAWFAWCAWRFSFDAENRDRAAARLFAASLVYLPLVMAALVVDRL